MPMHAAAGAAALVAAACAAQPVPPGACGRCAVRPAPRFDAPRGAYPPAWEAARLEAERARRDPATGGNLGFDAPFVVARHRLLFCKIAKVASSGWLRLLRRMGGDPGWRGDPYFLRAPTGAELRAERADGRPWSAEQRIGGARQLRHLPLGAAAALLRDGNWTRVVVVRDPAERLRSAFLDKVRRRADSGAQLDLYAKELFGLPREAFANETLADFVDRVAFGLARGEGVDQHWAPQASQCDLRTWAPLYDLILVMREGDDMDALLDCVLAAVAAGSPRPGALAAFRDTFRHTRAAAAAHASAKAAAGGTEYTPGLLRRVRDMYAEDYALFGLGAPARGTR